jgi:hypothetical protein
VESSLLPQSVVVQSAAQVSCPLRDEAAILNTATGSYYGLQPVGARIWDMIVRPRTFGELHEALLAEYEVPPGECEEDLRRFIAELSAAGLVEVRDGPSAPVSASPAQ